MNDSMPKGLEFPEKMTLPALQQHMELICRHFAWDQAADEQVFLLLIEEVGEMAKAIRKSVGHMIEVNNPDKPVQNAEQISANLHEEFADVINYLLELANRFNVDLEKAYKDKMLANMKREWTKNQ